MKYGTGPVMPLGCFNSRGPGALAKISGIMDSMNYQAIFADNRVASTIRLRPETLEVDFPARQ